MRHHRLQLHTWLVPLSVVLAVASCDVTTNPGSFFVTYRANMKVPTAAGDTTTKATIDSVYYSPGTGKCVTTCSSDSTFIRVTGGAWNYSVELTVPSGATLEAHVFATGRLAGNAQFTAIWMTASGTLAGDSVTATTAPGTKFTLDIPKRTL